MGRKLLESAVAHLLFEHQLYLRLCIAERNDHNDALRIAKTFKSLSCDMLVTFDNEIICCGLQEHFFGLGKLNLATLGLMLHTVFDNFNKEVKFVP